MIISAIVAISKNHAIGRENNIPWYLPADLKYFKKQTLGHHIIMGRKSYESIGKPLPKRTNIIITRDPLWIVSNCLIAHSIEEALNLAYENGEKEVFIIGGGKIYEQTKSLWDRIYLTEVDVVVRDADVFFPQLDLKEWSLKSEDFYLADAKNEFNYNFKLLERK